MKKLMFILFGTIFTCNVVFAAEDKVLVTKKKFIDDNIKKLEAQFDAIDTNKDGKITEAEDKAYVKLMQEINNIRKEMSKLADTNKDGKITPEEQKALLEKMDTNKDGNVTLEEQKEYLKKNKAKK
jgi:Ca2+-binding EF-hand superfamily protein